MILWMIRYVVWGAGLLLSGSVLYGLSRIETLDDWLHGFPRETFLYFASTLVIAIWLLFWEWVRPFERYLVGRHSVLRDIAHLIQAGIVIGGLIPVLLWLPRLNLLGCSDWPLPLQVALLLLPQDLLIYAWHRTQHESGVGILWRLHIPHHTPRRVSIMASARNHAVDEVALMITIAVVVCLLGPSSEAALWLIWYIAIVGALAHANCDFRLGKLNWLIPGPEFHRIHHDIDPQEALNYSPTLPVWDLVLGTARPLAIGAARTYGIRDVDEEAALSNAD